MFYYFQTFIRRVNSNFAKLGFLIMLLAGTISHSARAAMSLQDQIIALQQTLTSLQAQIAPICANMSAGNCANVAGTGGFMALYAQIAAIEAQIASLQAQIAAAAMPSVVVVGGVAGVVTTAAMAAAIAYYNRQAAVSAQQIQIANQQIRQRAAQQNACMAWQTSYNLYMESMDDYNMMVNACRSNTILWIGSFINANCYGLTPPVNNVGPRPSGC